MLDPDGQERIFQMVVEAAIAQSRYILELGDDWDDEGAPGYNVATWQKAADLTRTIARKTLHLACAPLVPTISHGPNGSIDLHWRTTAFEVLLNVPADPGQAPRFYGDDFGASQVKDKLDHPRKLEVLIEWFGAHGQ